MLIEKDTHPFTLRAPYELYRTGSDANLKPLFVYLHGYKQNNILFRKKMKHLRALNGYHLFIQGPYPLPTKDRPVEEWGAAWYTYDGDQQKFAKSLEHTATYIDKISTSIRSTYNISEVAMIGYSMGGYQAGYYALSRFEKLNYLVVVSARIKTELFNKPGKNLKNMKILAVHGQKDRSVKEAPQQQEIEILKENSVDATLIPVKTGHRLNETLTEPVYNWFIKNGFEPAE